jgi:hypothetical protein
MIKILLVFVISFVLNWGWENLHARLYDNYKGGKITQFILLRATLADAFMITALASPFILYILPMSYRWLLPVIALIVAVLIEKSAMKQNRWAYKPSMPIIPILNVGLTPTIQLALLGYISLLLVS